MKKLLLALVLTVSLAGCASITPQNADPLELPVTYGTLKVIERDNDIDAQEVLSVVNKLEAFVELEQELTSNAIEQYVTGLEEWQSLTPADKYLLSTLFESVEQSIQTQLEVKEMVPSEVKQRVGVILSYIKTAAKMS